MRILFVTPSLPLATKPRPFHFITGLARDHEVHVLVQDRADALEKATRRPELARLRRACAELTVVPHSRSRAYASCAAALVTREALRVAYCRSPALARAVERRLAGGGYDVLHVDRERLAPLGRVSGDVRRVLDYTDAISAYNRAAATVERPHWRLLLQLDARRMERFEASVRPHFDAAIATTPADRDLLGGGRVRDVAVVPNGVDLERFAPGGMERRDRLAFVGVMSYLPNVEAARFLAREVVPALRGRYRGAGVDLVGADPAPSVRALGSIEGVRVTGWVPDVRPFVREAALLVAPLRVGGGFPNKLAEGMAMGKAILATPEAAAGLDAVPGLHLEVAGRDEFADVAAALLQDEERRLELGAAARVFAEERLGWDAVIAQLVRCYEREPQTSQTVMAGV